MVDDDEIDTIAGDEELKKYAKEAQERWGNTEAYKQSQEKVKKLGFLGMAKVAQELDRLMKEIAKNMDKGVKSDEVQKLMDEHYNHLRNFYEPTLEMYRGLGNMYVQDPRFSAFFNKYKPGMAEFVRDAINEYCDRKSK